MRPGERGEEDDLGAGLFEGLPVIGPICVEPDHASDLAEVGLNDSRRTGPGHDVIVDFRNGGMDFIVIADHVALAVDDRGDVEDADVALFDEGADDVAVVLLRFFLHARDGFAVERLGHVRVGERRLARVEGFRQTNDVRFFDGQLIEHHAGPIEIGGHGAPFLSVDVGQCGDADFSGHASALLLGWRYSTFRTQSVPHSRQKR